MLSPQETTRFRRDLRRMRRRGKDLEKLKRVVRLLVAEEPLEVRRRDHALVGEWLGYRDCHVEPDWLLIYKVDGEHTMGSRYIVEVDGSVITALHKTQQEDGGELDTHGQKYLDGMEARAGGQIIVQVGVVHTVQSPQGGDRMHHHVL